MKYLETTKQNYNVLRIYNDTNDTKYLTAIIQTKEEFIIARGYNTATGEWNQGHYGYLSEDSAIYHLHLDFEGIIEMKPIWTYWQGHNPI